MADEVLTFGVAIGRVRKYTGLGRQTCANILGVSIDELRQIESDQRPIPHETLMDLLHGGLIMMSARKILTPED